MKQLAWLWLSVFFPWVVFLLKDNPGAAIVALAMQATVIGWLPATIWAWREVRNTSSKNNKQ